MVAFELTMPGCPAWNGKWSGDGHLYVKVVDESRVPKELINNKYYHKWNDGWEACISVYKVTANEGRKLVKQSAGLSGYGWMVDALIKYGRITTGEEENDKR